MLPVLLLIVTAQTPAATWDSLIEARVSRSMTGLPVSAWSPEMKSELALQEYLLTLGQAGEPAASERIIAFFSHSRLQATALFAYGECDGAPLDPLFAQATKVQPENLPLLAESMAKLATADDGDRLYSQWSGWTQALRNRALFYFWRHPSEELNRAVINHLVRERAGAVDGYLYYLFRARVSGSADQIVTFLDRAKGSAQALIYALRIGTKSPSPALEKAYVALSDHEDWRVRVQAVGALSTIKSANRETVCYQLLSDPNPNVVRSAIRTLVQLRSAKADRALALFPQSFTPSQIQTMCAIAGPKQLATFFPLLKTWKMGSLWQTRQYVRFLGQQPASVAALRAYLQDSDRGRAQQAFAGYLTQNPTDLNDKLRARLASGDPYQMASAISAYADRGSLAESPLSRQAWVELASKTYPEIDVHQAYLRAMQKWLGPEDAQQLYRGLLEHPDYRVRLFALQAMEAKTVTQADRQAVFRTAWQSGVPREVRQLASLMIQGKAPKTWELTTAKGKVLIELATAYAPITCANLVTLSKQRYFDGMPFHRVVANFVVQGGDSRGDGSGGPGYAIPCEVNPLRYRRGAVGMALTGKDTGGSQFFICHSDQPHLDGGYTVFGRVVAGMDLVDRLEEGDVILSAKVK